MEKFKMIPELGMIPFNDQRIIYVGGQDADRLNAIEKSNVELRRLDYMKHLISLDVSPRSPHWKRLTGEK